MSEKYSRFTFCCSPTKSMSGHWVEAALLEAALKEKEELEKELEWLNCQHEELIDIHVSFVDDVIGITEQMVNESCDTMFTIDEICKDLEIDEED